MDLGRVKLGGKVDRVDLIFADTGELKMLRVLDYKGPSRSRSKAEEYVDEIVRNLDCQLPGLCLRGGNSIYSEPLTPKSSMPMTETGYLFYEREFSKVGRSVKKSLIPMSQSGMVEGFLATLFHNIHCLENGRFFPSIRS